MVKGFNYIVIDEVNYKVCSKCKLHYLPNSDNFNKSGQALDGLNSHCRKCRSVQNSETYRSITQFKWTNPKVKFLKKVYHRYSNNILAKKLKTSQQSIRTKASKLGLKKEIWKEKVLADYKRGI